MPDLRIKPTWIESYLRHVAGGEGIREISRATGVHPSTVLRRVRLCEDLQTSPEWSLVFEALIRAAQAPANGLPRGYGRDVLLQMLGTSIADMGEALDAVRHAGAGAEIIVSDQYARAAIMARGKTCGGVEKPVALAMVLLGLAAGAGAVGGIARLVLTEAAASVVVGRPARAAPVPPCHAAQRRTGFRRWPEGAERLRAQLPSRLTHEQRAEAFRLAEAFALDPEDAERTFPRDVLGRDLSTVLKRYIVAGDGLEEIEKSEGWPCRSAKLVLAIALDRLAAWRLAQ
ncbi:DUF6456 domain-containing protein [Tropicimonas sp. IMCC34043]|uniref:DUF6456 domain-containing protein n=1 Tax=Tropicimonas sp. IMCC34043 TaxID=2248760 RepID=UPI000E253397|nr:DUF6456 domain-containing protein [Tropicimonas sp. IMCC34043]